MGSKVKYLNFAITQLSIFFTEISHADRGTINLNISNRILVQRPGVQQHDSQYFVSPFLDASFTSWGQGYKFRLRKPSVLLAFVQILLPCGFHFKSSVIVTRRYLILITF